MKSRWIEGDGDTPAAMEVTFDESDLTPISDEIAAAMGQSLANEIDAMIVTDLHKTLEQVEAERASDMEKYRLKRFKKHILPGMLEDMAKL